MKEIDVYGVGNAIVDLLVEVNEPDFRSLNYPRASMQLVDVEEQASLIERFSGNNPSLVSGGSVANSIICLAGLGGKGALACRVGDDPYGLHYVSELESLGIEFGNPVSVGGKTGTSVILITPDSERTMRTNLGVNQSLTRKQIENPLIESSKWLFIEGYLLGGSSELVDGIVDACNYAKSVGTKIALTCSDSFVITLHRTAFERVAGLADLIFANEMEAVEITQASGHKEALQKFEERFPSFAITAGNKGAYLKIGEQSFHADAFEVQPTDLTGAGDVFAGTFLYSLTAGLSPKEAAYKANYLASKVIQTVGARLHLDPKTLFAEC